MSAWTRVCRYLRHTRVVQSGSPPLYRLLALATVASAVAQSFAQAAPESVAALTPGWFDWAFTSLTGVGGALVLVGLYMTDENRFHATKLADSLNIERFGLSLMMTVIAVNIVAVWFFYGRPPASTGSWLQIGFWFWSWTRLWDIRKALKELTR